MNDRYTSALGLYLLVSIFVGVALAFWLEKRLKARRPHLRPYKWGIYTGLMNLSLAPLAPIFLGMFLSNPGGERGAVLGIGLFLYFGALAFCGWFMIRRKRWAWVLGTILQFNVVVWIINGIYQKNRWAEFTEESR